MELELTGDSRGTPVEPLTRALQDPLDPSGFLHQHSARSRGEIELTIAVGMRTREREKGTRGRMQYV